MKGILFERLVNFDFIFLLDFLGWVGKPIPRDRTCSRSWRRRRGRNPRGHPGSSWNRKAPWSSLTHAPPIRPFVDQGDQSVGKLSRTFRQLLRAGEDGTWLEGDRDRVVYGRGEPIGEVRSACFAPSSVCHAGWKDGQHFRGSREDGRAGRGKMREEKIFAVKRDSERRLYGGSV